MYSESRTLPPDADRQPNTERLLLYFGFDWVAVRSGALGTTGALKALTTGIVSKLQTWTFNNQGKKARISEVTGI